MRERSAVRKSAPSAACATGGPAGSSGAVTYALTLFPKLSETFVLNEVVGLQRLGLDVRPVSLDSEIRLEPVAHDVASELHPPVIYTKDWSRPQFVASAALLGAKHPVRAARAGWLALRLPTPRGEHRLGRLAHAIALARLLLDDRGSGRIHSHWSYPTDVALIANQVAKVSHSVTLHAHDIFEDLDLYEASGWPIERRLAGVDVIVTCTTFNRSTVASRFPSAGPSPKVVAAYHGLDPRDFPFRLRRLEGAGRHRPLRLVSVGRAVPYKGFDRILRLQRSLLDDGLDVEVVLAGSPGSLSSELPKLREELDLTDCSRVLGHVTQDEVRALLDGADIFVNYSNPQGEYGVANVIVEAMASGLPVVVTDRPHTREYIEPGVNGFLFAHPNPDEALTAIARLVSEPGLSESIGDSARETVETRFSIAETLRTMAGLFGAPQ
jgi:colanic acid/amylovoran biosynthesis glycosyltransferase